MAGERAASLWPDSAGLPLDRGQAGKHRLSLQVSGLFQFIWWARSGARMKEQNPEVVQEQELQWEQDHDLGPDKVQQEEYEKVAGAGLCCPFGLWN